MTNGYEVNQTYDVDKYTTFIVCDNYHHINTVSFYLSWDKNPEPLLSGSTVAIFKLKWKS